MPKKLRKCKICRKIVDTNLYDDHVKRCSSRISIPEDKEDRYLLSCRRCYMKHPYLVIHLCESSQCRQRYSKQDYFELFELWYRGLMPPDHTKKLKPSRLKLFYEVIEKNTFPFETSIANSKFCNSCGMTTSEDQIEGHFEVKPKCAKDYIPLSPKNCSSCNQPYILLLSHLEENPECRTILFGLLEPSTEETKLKSLGEEMRTCGGCGERFQRNSILKHLGQKEPCKSKYSSQQLEDLRNDCHITKPLRMKLLNRKRTGIHSNKNNNNESYLDISKRKKKETLIKPHHNIMFIDKQPTAENVACISCGKCLPISNILKHLTMMPECKSEYSPEQLKHLTLKCKEQRKKNKNYRRNQRAWEEKGRLESKMKMKTRIKNFKSIKDKIRSGHLKCVLGIELKKVFHYKWELKKLERKLLPLRPRLSLTRIRDQLDNLVIKLEDHINGRIKEIKSCTAKWCFNESVQNLSDQQYNDIEFVKSKCDILAVEVADKFNKQLSEIVGRLRKTLSDIGLELNQFENCEIYFNHQSHIINNTGDNTGDKTGDITGVEKRIDIFIIEELTKFSKRYAI